MIFAYVPRLSRHASQVEVLVKVVPTLVESNIPGDLRLVLYISKTLTGLTSLFLEEALVRARISYRVRRDRDATTRYIFSEGVTAKEVIVILFDVKNPYAR